MTHPATGSILLLPDGRAAQVTTNLWNPATLTGWAEPEEEARTIEITGSEGTYPLPEPGGYIVLHTPATEPTP